MRKELLDKKRIVVKVGTSTITHSNGNINLKRIDELAWELANIKNYGKEVVLVSSGAIACGAKRMNFPQRPRDNAGKQGTSAVGQVVLMNMYQRAFEEFGYHAAQILLTKQIEKDHIMYENSKNTFEYLMGRNVIPVVNENDTISTSEIEFGDNDSLSAYVARLIQADLLILLSDIDGLFSDDPNCNEDCEFIEQVDKIGEEIWDMAKGSNGKLGTGGMITKISAAELATERGIDVVIANGNNSRIITKIIQGENIGTLFIGEKHD